MLHIVVSDQTDPYLNVAVENYLLAQPVHDTVTLYLWRNHRTVVIGRNQNPFAECNLERLEADGGHLMRRGTGGGAVYHDGGNINFSFVAPHNLYSTERQFAVVAAALAHFGLEAEVSGRNDMLCNGRKFSGNAFSVGRHNKLHHGTLLIAGNMTDLQRYLKPKPAKLLKHGVQSVQSRVVNLSDINAEITTQTIVPHLIAAFEEIYGESADVLEFSNLAAMPEVQHLRNKFASPEWLYDPWRSFEAQRSGQFAWGEVELSLKIDNVHRVIENVRIATDALDLDAIAHAEQLLRGARVDHMPEANGQIERDIIGLVYC
ncbi:MAG: lipoate--protein ligase [Bacteroidales bacterium]|nr:lipoate--protein ligase [Bacteroidales bacterium]